MTHGTFHLFVYGSLRRDGSAAHMLQDCEWLGRASVGGVLYDIDGEYTTLVLYDHEPVWGEVWRCPWQMLARLDEYEGVGVGLFRRVAAPVRLEHGDEVSCWLYVAGPKLAHKLIPARRASAASSGLKSGGT